MDCLSVSEFLNLIGQRPVLDVRSPGEYAAGHLPGAISFPLFSDAQRSEIGILYKQVSPEAAMLRGLEIVGPQMADMVRRARNLCYGIPQQVAVYCWRGGKRSSSVAWLLETAGIKAVTLYKGYKAFRQFVLKALEQPRKVIILGGRTGSGKTELLKQLAEKGIQTIDLEKLAGHKGSAFGLIGSTGQPTQAQFENELGLIWSQLDPQKPVVIEDESRMIGRLPIPQPVWHLMRQAKVIYLDVPLTVRIQRLVQEYQSGGLSELRACLMQIERRLGGYRTQQALAALDRGDFTSAAAIILDYYDRAYDYGLSKRVAGSVYRITSDSNDLWLAVQEFLAS